MSIEGRQVQNPHSSGATCAKPSESPINTESPSAPEERHVYSRATYPRKTRSPSGVRHVPNPLNHDSQVPYPGSRCFQLRHPHTPVGAVSNCAVPNGSLPLQRSDMSIERRQVQNPHSSGVPCLYCLNHDSQVPYPGSRCFQLRRT